MTDGQPQGTTAVRGPSPSATSSSSGTSTGFRNEDPNHVTEDLGQPHIHAEKMLIVDCAAASQDSTPNHAIKCSCIACLKIGSFKRDQRRVCRFPSCNKEIHRWIHHEETHFKRNGRLHYLEDHCTFSTRRLSDLRRHYKGKHCKNPQKFLCQVIGCQYHEKGFTRADKLKSHYKAVHAGKTTPGKAGQAIQPKPKGDA